ncbi:hypothetical protein HNQ02_003099 [Flavobacterium sp. 7E]|uniref:hypothetical protein n=1 Tax=Flavobacterium sp. 7E TaxID=2735898 RepID=UPI00156F0A32|nr:hypothetical protein [Flavobacterium sp. 7E]NRS90162.1 hypothetical protein [Flavobacterium sp. 7E]
MKFKKVVYIRYFPLTKAIYIDLYFNQLLQNNIKVEYLDITDLFYPDRISAEKFDFLGTIKLSTYKQISSYLENQDIENTLFISIMTFEWRVFRLFRLFTKFNLKLGVFARGVFPNSTDESKKSKFFKTIKRISFERVIGFCQNKFSVYAKKTEFIKSYDYIFKAGEYGYWGLGIGSEIDNQSANIIEVNTVDYDQFLVHKKAPTAVADEYIVFLDQYLPYHPDASYFKIKTVDPIPYFKEVNGFFAKLELATGKKVIIAAHPKAERYKEFNPYNNREIFFNQSNDLVKGASLVLTHASTAVCFPICYEKKIVLLGSDYLNEILPQFLEVAKSLVIACDATLLAMDNVEEINISESLDLIKYNDFKYKYLTSTVSENQLSKDIFINFLKSEEKFLQ